MMKQTEEGVITVYLSIMLILVLGFLGGMLEGSRYYGAYWNGNVATNSAVSSVFAGYDRQLLDHYGLLLLNAGYEEEFFQGSKIEEELQTYIDSYVEPTKDKTFLSGGNFLGSLKKAVNIDKYYLATDNKGLYFKDAVVDYMKYEIVGDIGKGLLDKIGIIKEGLETKEEIDNNSQKAQEAIDSYLEEKEKTGKKQRDETIFLSLYEQLQKGYLSYILSDEKKISDKQLNKEGLPSSIMEKTNWFQLDFDISIIPEELIFNEYVISYLNNFSDKKESGGLLYEQEYVIFGQEKDIDNLTSAVTLLFVIRAGLNGAYLLKDTVKMGIAQTVGYTIATLLASPQLGDGITYFIIGLWAMAEAITDVNGLLSGKQVPLIKTSESWNLDLVGLVAFVSGQRDFCKESDDGFSYKDYLRLFLLFTNPTEKYYKTMDMIQENMCEINPDFRFSNCVYGLEGYATFLVSPVFQTFSLYPLKSKEFNVSFGKTY